MNKFESIKENKSWYGRDPYRICALIAFETEG